jgi:hypothetical protein
LFSRNNITLPLAGTGEAGQNRPDYRILTMHEFSN